MGSGTGVTVGTGVEVGTGEGVGAGVGVGVNVGVGVPVRPGVDVNVAVGMIVIMIMFVLGQVVMAVADAQTVHQGVGLLGGGDIVDVLVGHGFHLFAAIVTCRGCFCKPYRGIFVSKNRRRLIIYLSANGFDKCLRLRYNHYQQILRRYEA